VRGLETCPSALLQSNATPPSYLFSLFVAHHPSLLPCIRQPTPQERTSPTRVILVRLVPDTPESPSNATLGPSCLNAPDRIKLAGTEVVRHYIPLIFLCLLLLHFPLYLAALSSTSRPLSRLIFQYHIPYPTCLFPSCSVHYLAWN